MNPETLNQPAILSRKQIRCLLRKHALPMGLWGTGAHRSFDDLVNYRTNCLLFFRSVAGRLIVDVQVAVVVVVYCFRRQWLELYEQRQVFPDGPVLQRKSFNGIAETINRGETPREATFRCLAEELAFFRPADFELSDLLTVEHREPAPSEKWPGLFAAYHRNVFECVISRKLFRRNGYVEREDDRLIFFNWRPRRQLSLQI